ncbi:rhodanese-like domain-containing protein [Kangiella sediminilitoris]|uniref:Rhodanese domain protein n=1 Tax=Kangiella sediminilitoris TaxID=1144748 RepID=A0A1B3B7Q2_9GAMM|nr:rhodanese-like domain-containing protein [Kangiella sediminilitoris]AOE48806.1 Rhodanese domain protein [Kangiella sediminilitoris]
MSRFVPQEGEQVQFIEASELAQWMSQEDSPVVIDVSGEEKGFQSMIKEGGGTVSIPITEFASHINDWDPDQPVVVVCQLGQKSFNAAHRLIESDFSCVYSLQGGFEAWKRNTDH